MEFPQITATEPDHGSSPPENIGTNPGAEIIQPANASLGSLDHPTPVDPVSFPHQPRGAGSQLPATIANIKHLLTSYGIIARYDVIKKKLLITVPGYSGTPDNADNVAMSYIVSLASLNGLSTGQIHSYVATIGDRHQVNPVASWIMSKPWDGIDRLQAFYDTLIHREDFPAPLKEVLLYRWLISAIAAVLKPSAFMARGVLTLQGPQSIGKTAWINALVSDPLLREMVIKLDHHLDAGNKDSILTAVSHWIVEIGELDSSFKKDIARLKGFLTSDRDKLRRPYGRTDSEYPRRTVFCASVNDQAFLVDATGNTRWWTIPVTKINYTHGIDMQQVFAQVALDFQNGEPWWLTQHEEGCLERYNKSHRAISAIGERILDALDLSRVDANDLPAMTPTALLTQLGTKNPSNAQAKECAAVLREHLGEPKRIRGRNVWRIPLARGTWSPAPAFSDDDLY
jgi:putative DNA primase/helicase